MCFPLYNQPFQHFATPVSPVCILISNNPRAVCVRDRVCLPAAGQAGTTPRWLLDEWDIPVPAGRILVQPEPGTERPGCLCPCQGRLGLLQGPRVQPRNGAQPVPLHRARLQLPGAVPGLQMIRFPAATGSL